MKDAGFTAVRLPVKWSAHALSAAPYTIDLTFFKRIDWAVCNATSLGLSIIVNVHHYDELLTDPAAHLERFLALWRQIADCYKTQNDHVFFEILNEPNGKLEPLWNEYAGKALAVIRQSNPTRAVSIGPNGWNSIARLEELVSLSGSELDRAFLRPVLVHASRRGVGHARQTHGRDVPKKWHEHPRTLGELLVGQHD